jgi:hypothetical protein
MILICDRRAEQREDTVAGRAHQVALVAADRVTHNPKQRLDNRPPLFRVEGL